MGDQLGLRERKKLKTRQHIADTAATLFAEHGFEQVSVSDVARAAEVSEQTVYNYFSTKHDLVLDRADEIRDQLVSLVATRAADQTPADALRATAHEYGEFHRNLSLEHARGLLPALSASSPIVRRLLLESRDQTAEAMAATLVATTPGIHPAVARAHATALASTFQMIVDHIGHRTLADTPPYVVADELAPAVDAVLDDLSQHFNSIQQHCNTSRKDLP